MLFGILAALLFWGVYIYVFVSRVKAIRGSKTTLAKIINVVCVLALVGLVFVIGIIGWDP